MENDIGELLQSVLSDPEQMGKIASMARNLMEGETGSKETAAEPPEPIAPPRTDARLLAALTGMLGKSREQSRAAALLNAMRPYMRPEKQEKLDRALQAARLAHMAGAVMKELGGSQNGV